MSRVLDRCGHSVIEAASGEQGLEQIAKHSIDLVFCDLLFPSGMSGKETLDAIIRTHPKMKVVMMSCAMDYDVSEQLEKQGAAKSVQKPFFKDQCLEIVNELIPDDQQAA